MTNPFLSIITVTYNAESSIRRTLDSIASQSYRGFAEHLIIDGASKDGTLKIVDEYKIAHPEINVSVVSERDRGLYDAMNKGLKLAKGEFVCFMNAGDTFHESVTIENIFESVDKPETVGVIYGDTNVVDENGVFLRPRHLSAPEKLTWKSFQNGMLVCHQAFYARRTICEEYDLRYRFSADVDWCIRVMKAGEKAGLQNFNMQSVLADFMDAGMTSRNHKKSLRERFVIMAKHYGLIITVWNHVKFLFR